MTPRLAILLLLTGAAVVPLPAQDPNAGSDEPEELVQYRRMAELRALKDAQNLTGQFVNALASIMKEVGAEGDYDQAVVAQRRRENLIELYSKSLDETALTNVIVMKAAENTRVFGASYDRDSDALVGWKTAGSMASWDVTRLTPGTYSVTVTYAVADMGEAGRINPFAPPPDLTTGGEFEFYEDSSLTGAEQNRRTGKVESTGGWTEWTTLSMAPIQISRTSARFVVKVTKPRGGGGVMSLKSIRLAPVTPGSAASGTNADGTPMTSIDDMAILQASHKDRLKATVAPVVNTYIETMKSLASKTSDPAVAEDFQAEARRAAQIMDDPFSILDAPAKPKQGVNADGFHEIRDVTFVATDASATGDRFKVVQQGVEFYVKLLWVSCPPVATNPKHEKLLKEHATYFGISADDALAVGQQAQSFTASFLAGKPLRLVTRGQKDEAGNILASVRLNGVGDFAGVLVDNGLAMIMEVSGKKGPARQHEDTVLHGLKDREDTAKSRPIPPGAWARRVEPEN